MDFSAGYQRPYTYVKILQLLHLNKILFPLFLSTSQTILHTRYQKHTFSLISLLSFATAIANKSTFTINLKTIQHERIKNFGAT